MRNVVAKFANVAAVLSQRYNAIAGAVEQLAPWVYSIIVVVAVVLLPVVLAVAVMCAVCGRLVHNVVAQFLLSLFITLLFAVLLEPPFCLWRLLLLVVRVVLLLKIR